MDNLIIASNPEPHYLDFCALMQRLDQYLNHDAKQRPAYYSNRRDKALETDVFNALIVCAEGTAFEGSIELVSGSHFPDIVANKFYGVEVKSTKSNKWTSIGSSILESTRVQDVERIFITFGKMAEPIAFRSRPYEACMKGIAVTHYPRYQIDMNLAKGESIFDRMGIAYDVLRTLDDPITPVANYLKKHLKKGERLWWAGQSSATSSSGVLRLWSTLDKYEKDYYVALACALYPEIMGASQDKYHSFSLWLVTECSIVNNNIRDSFSAGGSVVIQGMCLPGIFKRLMTHKKLIRTIIEESETKQLADCWQLPIVEQERLRQWVHLVADYATEHANIHYNELVQVLCLEFELA